MMIAFRSRGPRPMIWLPHVAAVLVRVLTAAAAGAHADGTSTTTAGMLALPGVGLSARNFLEQCREFEREHGLGRRSSDSGAASAVSARRNHLESIEDDATRRKIENEVKLRRHLLDQYDRLALPPNAIAYVQLYLSQLISVDTANQQWIIGGWWRASWTDPRLAWNESEWEISSMAFTGADIWRPDEVVYDCISEQRSRSSQMTLMHAYPSGAVSVTEPRVTTLACRMNLAAFPFDTQVCNFTVGSKSHASAALDILPRPISDPASWWREQGEDAMMHNRSGPPSV
jgi:hypothetical protein